MATEHTFQIQLEGLITLLAQNLYADPDVFLREMIQNAHDSIIKRAELREERGEYDVPPGAIRIVVDGDQRTLAIQDNGSGLSADEIEKYVATIGRSGTGELRAHLREADRQRTVQLIGQFGIGLLSAFIVAREVEMITRRSGGDALRWRSTGNKNYTVEPSQRAEVGTTVVLHLRDEHRRYLDVERLKGIVRQYADFIGIPVYLQDEREPTNSVQALWVRSYPSAQERKQAYRDYWERRFPQEFSLEVLPVDEGFTVHDAMLPEGERPGRVRGILAITDRHVPDVNARGVVDLYVNRMFVCAGSRDVLPSWARFIQGVIDCDDLTLNAARDSAVRNQALEQVQQVLGRAILTWLTQLSRDNAARFTEIMRWHAYHVLAMSVQEEHEDFFAAVADLVPLDSDQGPITVPRYLETAPRRTDGRMTVYYIAERGSANQYYLLCSARSLHVFNCGEPFAESFLQRYERAHPARIHLARLDVSGSEAIFEPLSDEQAAAFRDLEAAYVRLFPDLRCIARMARFRPAELPAVVTESRDVRSRREMQDFAQNAALPAHLRNIIQGFLSERRDPLSLHLNADSPVIQQLARRPNLRDEISTNALWALYNNAMMLQARAITPEGVQAMFEQYNRVIELMLRLSHEREGLERTLAARDTELQEEKGKIGEAKPTPHVSCFVAMPFRDPRAQKLYHALETVIEDVPYCWSLVRADDSVEAPGLWDNLKLKMLRAHCCIAFISDANPNVMIEAGRMEALGRPILLLRTSRESEVPVDLSGLLLAEVNVDAPDLVTHVREMLARQLRFIDQKGERFLSAVVLRRAGVDQEVAQKLAQRYGTWEALLQASSGDIAAQVRVGKGLVEACQEFLRSLL